MISCVRDRLEHPTVNGRAITSFKYAWHCRYWEEEMCGDGCLRETMKIKRHNVTQVDTASGTAFDILGSAPRLRQ